MRLQRILLGLLLGLAACGNQPPTAGGKQTFFYLDVEALANSSRALVYAGALLYQRASEQLHQDRIAGKVRPMTGSGTLIVDITGVRFVDFPFPRTAYSQGQNPRGGVWTDIVPIPNGVRMRILISGDEGLGRTRLRLPYMPIATSKALGVCVTADFPLAYAPELTAGTHHGQANTVCGHAGFITEEVIGRRGESEVLFVLVKQ